MNVPGTSPAGAAVQDDDNVPPFRRSGRRNGSSLRKGQDFGAFSFDRAVTTCWRGVMRRGRAGR